MVSNIFWTIETDLTAALVIIGVRWMILSLLTQLLVTGATHRCLLCRLVLLLHGTGLIMQPCCLIFNQSQDTGRRVSHEVQAFFSPLLENVSNAAYLNFTKPQIELSPSSQ